MTGLFVLVGRIVVPKFLKWYYNKNISEKADEYYWDRCIGTGINKRGAKASIAIGVVFYSLMRIAVAFPEHFIIAMAALVTAFMMIGFIGDAYAGKIPNSDKSRFKYTTRFYAPTLLWVGLAFSTIIFDFLVQGFIIGLSFLKSGAAGAQVAGM